jgi:hypothetical protein
MKTQEAVKVWILHFQKAKPMEPHPWMKTGREEPTVAGHPQHSVLNDVRMP